MLRRPPGRRRDSLLFVTAYLDHENDVVAETAALALGESYLPEAFGILKDRLARYVLHSSGELS